MSKLLIVDDDVLRGNEIQLYAERLGITALVAHSPEQAEPLLGNSFDFAVIDIALYGELDEEGVDLIRLLHAKQPRCGIIALTSHREEVQIRAMRAGATYFINAKAPGQKWQDQVQEKLGNLISLVGSKASSS